MCAKPHRTLTLLSIGMLAASGCANVDISKTCRYSRTASLPNSDPQSLSLILSAPPGRIVEAPLVTIFSPSRTDVTSVFKFDTRHPVDLKPINLDLSRCKSIETMTFALSGDRDEWNSFWTSLDESSFEIGVDFLDSAEPIRRESFGFAIADANSGQNAVSCGCYSE